MIIKSLLNELANDLNDNQEGHSYITWTRDMLTGWIREALSIFYEKQPDEFIESRILEVQSCSVLQDMCDCDSIHRVIGQVTESGRLLKPLRERSLDLTFSWTGKSCKAPSGSFSLDGYAIDDTSDSLYLFPEVPPNVKVFVQVECAVIPSVDSDAATIEDKFIPTIKQWVLWRAKSMDMELSPAIANAVELHYKAFYDLLGIDVNTSTVIHKKAAT